MCVFWLQLLESNDSSNKVDRQHLAGFFAELSRCNVFNNSYLEENKTTDLSVRYPAGGTYKKPINITNAASDKFSLSLNWQYDENLVELFLQAAGFSAKQIKQVWFGKYVEYWSGEAIERTQKEWSRDLANHMQGYLLRPDYFEKVNGMRDEENQCGIALK